jgi:hypothetical protein
MHSQEKEKRRREQALHQKLAGQYVILCLIASFFGSVFWWAEQRRWKIADRLEDLEAQR